MPKAAARPLRVGDKVKNLDDGQIGTVMYIPRSVELTDTVVVRFGRGSGVFAFLRARRRALATSEYETLDHLRGSLLVQRRGDVASHREDFGGCGRHRDAVAHGRDHLEVVVLIADRHRLPERHAEPASEPADGPAL